MTSTIDANILLYASDGHSPLRDRALGFLGELATDPSMVYLFWPALFSYLRISTHPRVFREPLSVDEALSNIHDLIDRPNVRTVGEGPRFWPRLNEVVADARPTGNLFSDAHVVGLMLENGVRTIWTHDRDFRQFGGIQARDPFA